MSTLDGPRTLPGFPPGTDLRTTFLDCGVRVRASALAASGTAERQPGPTSDALRRFLAHNPFEGMGSVPAAGWLLLGRTPTALFFGHREGPVGVGAVVTLGLVHGRFVGTEEGGCGTRLVPGGEADHVEDARATGRTLQLDWTNGSCDGGTHLTSQTVRTDVVETATTVWVTHVVRPAPGGTPAGGFCAGVGVVGRTTVRLRAPLGHRRLLDAAGIPPVAVPLQPSRPSQVHP